MDLRGRSAIVTGAAGGLGAATARRLVQVGMQVVVFDRAVERARALAEDLGQQAVAVAGDVIDDGDVAAAIDAACSLGVLSVLVNVAGGGVGAIAPGPMGTPVMRRVTDRLDADPTVGIVFPRRMGEPDEFALLVETIVRNPCLNGESIRLDGALRLSAG
jgi:NAD(P)-dependent dehydrogenase (short-subunit alcohol dehydrogenase family)